jgi:hypothetical protein
MFRINNENIEIDRQNQSRLVLDIHIRMLDFATDITNLCRTIVGGNYTLPAKTESYYTTHRDE